MSTFERSFRTINEFEKRPIWPTDVNFSILGRIYDSSSNARKLASFDFSSTKKAEHVNTVVYCLSPIWMYIALG